MSNKNVKNHIEAKNTKEYLNYRIDRYRKNGYTKKQIFDIILSTKSKIDIISDLKFNFIFDGAIPNNLWTDYKNPKFSFLGLNDHISIYPSNNYRLHFRIFPIIRLYKRFLTQLINKIFLN